jgi:hypothetical protein
MSNNLIRKGLAIGATVSLALAGLVGFAAPANAAGTVYLEPAEGTAYAVPLATDFTLQAYFDDAAQLGAEKVKFRVVAAAEADITVATSVTGSTYTATSNAVTGAYGPITYDAVRGDFVGHGNNTVGPTKSFLTIDPASAKTTSFSVTVQAWMDFNDDDKITAGEQASEVRTVNFVQTSGITATTVVDNYGVGDTSVTASIKTTPELNGGLMAGSGTPAAVSGLITASLTNVRSGNVHASTATTWDATNKEFDVTIALPSYAAPVVSSATNRTVTVTTTHTVRTGDTIRVEDASSPDTYTVIRAVVTGHSTTASFTYEGAAGLTAATSTVDSVKVVIGDNAYNVTPNFANSTALGSAVGSVVSSPVAASAEITAPTTANQAVSAVNAVNGDTTIQVRALATSLSASYLVYNDKDASVGAGKSVRISVSTATNLSANEVTVNGTKLTGSTGQVINAVTDANGSVALAITTTGGQASDVLGLTLVSESVSTTSVVLTVNWVAADYRVVDLNDKADHTANMTKARAATRGGSHTFNVQVHDQWMQPAPATIATHLYVTVTGRTVSTSYVPLSAGRASVTVADGGLGAATDAAVVGFDVKLLSGSTYSDSTGATDVTGVNVYFYSQTDAVALNADAVANADLANTITTQTTYAVDGGVSAMFPFAGTNKVRVTGTVTNSLSGAAKAGALVTISGPSNILFEAEDGVTAFGTLSYYDLDGTVDVDLYSNIVQKDSVITVTSGGVSKTVKVSFVAQTGESAISKAVVASVKSIKAGRTANVTMSVVDKFGNIVEVTSNTAKVTLSGPGYLTSYPTALAKGTANVTLVTGAGDFGKAVITLVADGKTAATTDDLTVTGAIWVGPVATAVAGADAGRVTIEAYRAKGKRVNVFVGSKRVASYVSDKAEFSKSVKVKTGTRNVRVVIQGPSSDFRGAIVVK